MAILGTIVLGALGPHATPSGFADALDTAFKVGAIVMAVAFVIARAFMPAGKAIAEPGPTADAVFHAGVE
jgi:hypothetical protein